MFLGPSLLPGQVRLVGSDLVGEVLQGALAAQAESQGWDLTTTFSGSSVGQQALERGEADVAILALPNGPEGRALAGRTWPLAYEVAALVTHGDNPIRELDFVQVGNVFGEGNDFARWGRLGATGTWENRPLRLHAVRNSRNLSLEILKARVLGSREISPSVRYWDSTDQLLAYVATTPEAIALVGASPRLGAARGVLAVAQAEGGAPHRPTPAALLYGDYALRLGYYVVIAPDADEAALAVARFLHNDLVANALEAAGYVPVPSTERRQFVLEMDLAGR